MLFSRLRGQDGFIREVVWIVVVLAVLAVVVLDGMAIFRAHQSANDAAKAAREARTEYAQSLDVTSAKLAAQERLARSGLEMIAFHARRSGSGIAFTVKARATADTFAFRYLGKIPQLEEWVERTTHPVSTSTVR